MLIDQNARSGNQVQYSIILGLAKTPIIYLDLGAIKINYSWIGKYTSSSHGSVMGLWGPFFSDPPFQVWIHFEAFDSMGLATLC